MKLFAIALLASAAAPLPAIAQVERTQQMVMPQDPQTLVNAMQAAGYRAELTTDSSGDPMINSSTSGTNFSVFFYGCQSNANCTTIQFYAGFSDPDNASLRAMNEWNRDNRFGRAYVADDGSARIEMDVDMDDGGISTLLFHDNIEFWEIVMSNFKNYIFE